MDRREFLKNLGLVAAAAVVPAELMTPEEKGVTEPVDAGTITLELDSSEIAKLSNPPAMWVAHYVPTLSVLSSDEAFTFDWPPYGGFHAK